MQALEAVRLALSLRAKSTLSFFLTHAFLARRKKGNAAPHAARTHPGHRSIPDHLPRPHHAGRRPRRGSEFAVAVSPLPLPPSPPCPSPAPLHHLLPPFLPQSLLIMVRGRGSGAAPVATRTSARQRLPPPSKDVWAERAMRGGGRGRSRGLHGARGRGGRGGALIALPLAAPPPMDGHVGDQPLEFIIRLYKSPRGRLRLPTPFASTTAGCC